MKRLIVTLASLALMVSGGSAAGAFGSGRTVEAGPAQSLVLPPPGADGIRTQTSSELVGGLLGVDRSVVDEFLRRAVAGPGSPAGGLFEGLAPGAFAGYSSGTASYSDAALSGKERPVDIEVAFSGAAFASSPLGPRADELGRSVAPDLKASRGFGRGSAVDLVIGGQKDEIDDDSDAEAPPVKGVATKEAFGARLTPLVEADALWSQASARSAADGCVLGSDLAYGLGSANNTHVGDTKENKDDPRRPILSLSADNPRRAVTQSMSRTRLVAPRPDGPPNAFGLLSEVRQTIAPVTFQAGGQQYTVEVAGEWVLRAEANGSTGSLSFGPDATNPEKPMFRLIDSKGNVVDQVDLAQLTDELAIDAPDLKLFLGEDTRAIGGDGTSKPLISGTAVAGAVDVVRLLAVDPENNPVQLRIGHMEVAVAVPPGGIQCPGIGLAKSLDRAEVRPGERFAWDIQVTNPNSCLLDELKVIDRITATPGLRYEVVGTTPKSGSRSPSGVTFDGLGPLAFGQSKSLRVEVAVAQDSPPGSFSDEAEAIGVCRPDPVEGERETSLGVGAAAPSVVARKGRVSLDGPAVTALPVGLPAPPPAISLGDGPVVTRGAAAGASLPSASASASASARAAARRSSAAPGSRPPAVAGKSSRTGALARTGGLAVLPALLLLNGGLLLRRLTRRRESRRAEVVG